MTWVLYRWKGQTSWTVSDDIIPIMFYDQNKVLDSGQNNSIQSEQFGYIQNTLCKWYDSFSMIK